MGEHIFNLLSGREQFLTVNQIHMHPSYVGNEDFDFCLLQVGTPITFNEYVQPVCMPLSCTDECPEEAEIITAGWGDRYGGTITVFTPLQKSKMPHVSRTTCATAYSAVGTTINDNMLCAGYISSGGIGICNGDSGSAMICYRNGYFQIDGVTALTEDCASARYPSVYGRVCKVLDWIDTTMNI